MAASATDISNPPRPDAELNASVDNDTDATREPNPVKQPSSKRNAFSELMSPKPTKSSKQSSASASVPATMSTTSQPKFYAQHMNRAPTDPRAGLLAYIQNPSSFPNGTILRKTQHTVLIRDLYPKATIHLLLLPRSPSHYNLHPHDAFKDTSFLDLIKTEANSAAKLAASELSRLIGTHSTSDRARNEALDLPDPPSPSSLPPGRNYLEDIRTGIHAHPSMSHLHIHIISRDMHSAALKHRKHYNSFNTDFFIPLTAYPLADDNERKSVAYQNANLKRDYVCWRCGRGFGNKFVKLKEHLEEEFVAWRAE